MKISEHNKIEEFVYILACICTLGFIWLIKIIITQAIKDALDT